MQAAIERTVEVDLAALSVDAEVTRDARGYRLALTLETPAARSERELVAERCDTFVELVALELGMISASAPAARPAPRIAWGLRASGGIGTGPGPGFAPRVQLTGVLQRRALRAELGAGFDLPRTTHYDAPSNVGARLYAFSGQLRLCDALALANLELPLCGGVEAGAWRGEGLGVDSAGTATRPWLALVVGAGLRYPRDTPVAVFVGLDSMLGLLRPRYGFRNLPPLYRPARLALRGSLGVELHFD